MVNVPANRATVKMAFTTMVRTRTLLGISSTASALTMATTLQPKTSAGWVTT